MGKLNSPSPEQLSMTRFAPRKSNSAVRQISEQILSVGQISRQEYLRLTSAILAETELSDEERHQINCIFDQIQTGLLKMVD
jgi:hypothetical protein